MVNLLKKTLSPQSAKVYSLLLKHPSLSAKEIGQKIGIVPNTIYRDIKALMELGLVREIHQYPIKYQVKPANEAISLFSSIIQQNFRDVFGLDNKTSDKIRITFFQTRKEFIKLVEKDNYRAKKQINFIVSGHEIPAETILSNKKALDRGIRIRRLIQGWDSARKTMIKNWEKLGIEVRQIPNMDMRIVTYDSEVAYFSSYNLKQHSEAIGVRFDYPPLAALMDQLFEQKWQQGKVIN